MDAESQSSAKQKSFPLLLKVVVLLEFFAAFSIFVFAILGVSIDVNCTRLLLLAFLQALVAAPGLGYVLKKKEILLLVYILLQLVTGICEIIWAIRVQVIDTEQSAIKSITLGLLAVLQIASVIIAKFYKTASASCFRKKTVGPLPPKPPMKFADAGPSLVEPSLRSDSMLDSTRTGGTSTGASTFGVPQLPAPGAQPVTGGAPSTGATPSATPASGATGAPGAPGVMGYPDATGMATPMGTPAPGLPTPADSLTAAAATTGTTVAPEQPNLSSARAVKSVEHDIVTTPRKANRKKRKKFTESKRDLERMLSQNTKRKEETRQRLKMLKGKNSSNSGRTRSPSKSKGSASPKPVELPVVSSAPVSESGPSVPKKTDISTSQPSTLTQTQKCSARSETNMHYFNRKAGSTPPMSLKEHTSETSVLSSFTIPNGEVTVSPKVSGMFPLGKSPAPGEPGSPAKF